MFEPIVSTQNSNDSKLVNVLPNSAQSSVELSTWPQGCVPSRPRTTSSSSKICGDDIYPGTGVSIPTMSILRRLSSNPFTNWQSNTDLTDLSPQLKDEIFIWQLGATDFCRIDTSTLLRAKVVDSENYASRLLSGAQKCGIIDPSTGQPNTSKIDRDVVKSLPIVTVPNRKQLVMLLFFWEEEIVRWSLLCGEERELKARLEAGEREAGEELSFVQAKKRVRPSLRDQSGRMTLNQEDELPTYEEARRERRG